MDASNLEHLAATFGLSESAIAQRMNAIGLTPKRRQDLSASWDHVQLHANAFVDKLYTYFLAEPQLSSILSNESRVPKLKAVQKVYLQELICDSIDRNYVLKRISVGLVHHRIRLTPQWYLASYAHFLCEHVDLLISSSLTLVDGRERIVTLLQTVFLDAGIVLDAYGIKEDALRIENSGPTLSAAPANSNQHELNENKRQRSQSTPEIGMSRIRLTSEETASRVKFIGIDSQDLERLRSLREAFASSSKEVLSAFYTFITESPEYASLVPAHQIKHLITQVQAYWHEFIEGSFDRPYAASRMRVGVIHERIGVTPQLYLVGLSRQIVGFIRSIPTDLPDYAEVLKSLFKAIIFDVTFVIDAYMESRAQTLLRTEGYAKQLMAGLHASVVVVDADSRIQFANKGFVSIVGIEPALLCRMRLTDALPLNDLRLQIESLRDKGASKTTSLQKWANSIYRVSVVKLDEQDEGRRNSFAVMLDDVSELVRISDDIERDGTQYTNLVHMVSAVLWEMDFVTKTIYTISRPSLELTGRRDVAFLGRPAAWFNCIDEKDRERFFVCCATLKLGERSVCDYRFLRADGAEVWLRSHVTRLPSNGSTNFIIAAVTIDITQSRKAENLRLEAISRVAGGVSHVMNNALMVIVSNVELQLAISGSSQDMPCLQAALKACQRAAAVTKQLQAFAGGNVISPSVHAIDELLPKKMPELLELLGNTIRTSVKIEGPLWKCRFDGRLFSAVLDQICLNAKESMPIGGMVTIRACNTARDTLAFDDPGFNRDWVELSVIDTGCGMTDEVRRRAVEPFYGTHDLAQHSGLGLSLVYGFMLQSGGHMLLNSQTGVGTEVVLRFPKIDSPLQLQTRAADDALPAVLILDDDEAVVQSVAAQIQFLGYQVQTALSANDALELFGRMHFDILLSDIYLGEGVDGIELAKQIVSQYPSIKVIIMSGYAKDEFSNQELLPDWRFLAKPFTIRLLESTLQSMCGKSVVKPSGNTPKAE